MTAVTLQQNPLTAQNKILSIPDLKFACAHRFNRPA